MNCSALGQPRRAFQRFYTKFIETAYPIEDIYIDHKRVLDVWGEVTSKTLLASVLPLGTPNTLFAPRVERCKGYVIYKPFVRISQAPQQRHTSSDIQTSTPGIHPHAQVSQNHILAVTV
uniref:Uncharacterized protein n=1 Tax=Timema cristinae TaxID=61476 RepID=A0A7R9H5B7_TIMCR|nr:unnamed protein product [Timema cristinae]